MRDHPRTASIPAHVQQRRERRERREEPSFRRREPMTGP